jgi:hypothetical protein
MHSGGERKYYLSNLPAATPLRALAITIKARPVCEQAHRQLKKELELGHFAAFMGDPASARADDLDRLRLHAALRRLAEPAGRAARHSRPTIRPPHNIDLVSALQRKVPASAL